MIRSLCSVCMICFVAPVHGADVHTTFDNESMGGGSPWRGSGAASVVASSHLQGAALRFDPMSQVRWARQTQDPSQQCVGFDFFAASKAHLTQFLDVPSIVRIDVEGEGTHRLDIYYDLPGNTVAAYLDGMAAPDLVTIAAWPNGIPASAKSMRVAASASSAFEIDNLTWQGGIAIPNAYAACRQDGEEEDG